MLVRNVELLLNYLITLTQYLIKGILACIIFIIYLKTNLLKKFIKF